MKVKEATDPGIAGVPNSKAVHMVSCPSPVGHGSPRVLTLRQAVKELGGLVARKPGRQCSIRPLPGLQWKFIKNQTVSAKCFDFDESVNRDKYASLEFFQSTLFTALCCKCVCVCACFEYS